MRPLPVLLVVACSSSPTDLTVETATTDDTTASDTTASDTGVVDTDPPESPLPAGTWTASLRVRTTDGCEVLHEEAGVAEDAPCDDCLAFRVALPRAPCEVPFLDAAVLRVVRWDGPGDPEARLLLGVDEAYAIEALARPAPSPEGDGALALVFDAPAGPGGLDVRRARVEGTARFSLSR